MNVGTMKILSRGAAASLATLAISVAAYAGGAGRQPGTAATSARAMPVERARPVIGKVRPPVEVTLAPGTKLEAGVPAQLLLHVRSAVGVERVQLAIEGDAGLSVVGAARHVPGAPQQAHAEVAADTGEGAGGGTWFEISATPTSGGTRHLSGLVTFSVNGVSQAAPFSLPVEIAGPVTAPPQAVQKLARPAVRDATGELVDSMAAETTVR